MFLWKLQEISWLEEEEEQVLQKRVEMQELEEELRRREEVLQQRETCLQQKRSLETKILRSSQVSPYFCDLKIVYDTPISFYLSWNVCVQSLSQDLLRVSLRLECVEEQLQSSSFTREGGGDTIEELVKERDMLKKKRDVLDAQLRDNRGLSVEVRKHTRPMYFSWLFRTLHHFNIFSCFGFTPLGGVFPSTAGGSN